MLADCVCLPQPCVPVACQVASDHVAFSQKCDEKGNRDGCDQDSHQELPVVTGISAFLACQSVCKKGQHLSVTLKSLPGHCDDGSIVFIWFYDLTEFLPLCGDVGVEIVPFDDSSIWLFVCSLFWAVASPVWLN